MEKILKDIFPVDIVEFGIIPYIYDKKLRMQQTKIRDEKRRIKIKEIIDDHYNQQKRLQRLDVYWKLLMDAKVPIIQIQRACLDFDVYYEKIIFPKTIIYTKVKSIFMNSKRRYHSESILKKFNNIVRLYYDVCPTAMTNTRGRLIGRAAFAGLAV